MDEWIIKMIGIIGALLVGFCAGNIFQIVLSKDNGE